MLSTDLEKVQFGVVFFSPSFSLPYLQDLPNRGGQCERHIYRIREDAVSKLDLVFIYYFKSFSIGVEVEYISGFDQCRRKTKRNRNQQSRQVIWVYTFFFIKNLQIKCDKSQVELTG